VPFTYPDPLALRVNCLIPPRPCADAVVNVETPTPPKIVAS